jgi:hypothetical protein
MQAPTQFWATLVAHEEQLKELRIVFINRVKYGLPKTIKGIRSLHDPSIIESNNPTILVFRESRCIAGRKWRCVFWKSGEGSNSADWEKFTREVSDGVGKKWPKYLCSFQYCRNCFRGASVSLTELSYNEHGVPKQVRCNLSPRKRFIPAIPTERPKATNNSLIQYQPAWGDKIFGRSWYAGLSSNKNFRNGTDMSAGAYLPQKPL